MLPVISANTLLFVLQLTLHLSSSNHISSRHTGHIHQIYWAAGLQSHVQSFIYQSIQRHLHTNRILKSGLFTLLAMVTAL